MKPKEVWILASIVLASGKAFKELKLEKDGKWKPGSVFAVKDFTVVVGVQRGLEKSILG